MPFEPTDQALNRALAAANAEGRLQEAKGICADILSREPESAGAIGLLGGVFAKNNEWLLAKDFLERAIKINPTVATWHINLATTNRVLCCLNDAVKCCLEALKYVPEHSPTYVELALNYLAVQEYDKAKQALLKAVRFDPENPAAHMGLGELLLLLGEYKAGWLEYAWRNKLEMSKNTLPKMHAAPWNGMAMPEATIMLVADQGFGDSFQFSRYIPFVKNKFKKVIIGWGPDITAIFTDFPGVDQIIDKYDINDGLPEHDFYCLLSSLPQLFDTTIDNIPPPVKFPAVTKEKIDAWLTYWPQLNSKALKIGVSWSGRPTHPNNGKRSVGLEKLVPLLEVPYTKFYCLQKEIPPQDITLVEKYMVHDAAKLTDFTQTAALAKNLDMVICIDTSVAHLCAVEDVPVWILVATPNDWRWLLPENGYDTTSPWYKSVTLCRQRKHHDWEGLIKEVAGKISVIAKAKYLR